MRKPHLMNRKIVLFGAGSAGRYTLKFLREKGIEPVAFADNDRKKVGSSVGGITVCAPDKTTSWYPTATWVACGISRPAATEIREHIKSLGVDSIPLWECLPVCHGLPPENASDSISTIVSDVESMLIFNDQCTFRSNPNYDDQPGPTSCKNIYFPDFIKHLDEEVFIDCGACDGDSVQSFIDRWPKFKSIVAFEPDTQNFRKLCQVEDPEESGRITRLRMAVGDIEGSISFTANGDYSSHIGGGTEKVRVVKLDDMLGDIIPTYVKMDIEGAELEALWGARRILKEHAPVLAICAYHTSDHLWQIPLLIHAINPDYSLYLRRYAEGAFELVWYAVPPERIIADIPFPADHESYSDNHTG